MKVSYASLKLKVDTEVKTFDYEGNKIEVLQYLPIEDKYSLINIALQSSKEGNIYNQVKLEAIFNLYIVMMYSNITFTDKQKEDLFKLYDCLQSNGIIDSVIMNMAEGEYKELYNLLSKTLEDRLHYDNTAAGVINNLIESLPAQAEEMQKIVDNFDKEKFKNVLDFAKSANAGRPV
jgi:hypothetical protein